MMAQKLRDFTKGTKMNKYILILALNSLPALADNPETICMPGPAGCFESHDETGPLHDTGHAVDDFTDYANDNGAGAAVDFVSDSVSTAEVAFIVLWDWLMGPFSPYF